MPVRQPTRPSKQVRSSGHATEALARGNARGRGDLAGMCGMRNGMSSGMSRCLMEAACRTPCTVRLYVVNFAGDVDKMMHFYAPDVEVTTPLNIHSAGHADKSNLKVFGIDKVLVTQCRKSLRSFQVIEKTALLLI